MKLKIKLYVAIFFIFLAKITYAGNVKQSVSLCVTANTATEFTARVVSTDFFDFGIEISAANATSCTFAHYYHGPKWLTLELKASNPSQQHKINLVLTKGCAGYYHLDAGHIKSLTKKYYERTLAWLFYIKEIPNPHGAAIYQLSCYKD